RLMKEKKIRHIPVVKGDEVKGIISDRDIKEYSPSKATTLDVYELHYLLDKAKIKDVMKTKVITTSPDTPVEEAAMIMHDRNIGCLPVVDNNKLVGIITDKDIYRVLVDITGIRRGGHRIYLTIEDVPGSIRDVADIIRKHGFGLQSILTSYEGVQEGFRKIVIRTKSKWVGDFEALAKELKERYKEVSIKK
ncbi:MAG: CBS domain-containing protein, partial [Thermodesulfovibrio sp.]|nr:CBS domain-containing protein [Thermodesulfovibrio sp.]